MHKHLKPIIALVGPSGCGKSALILNALQAMPDKLVAIKTITTRKPRDPEDQEFYRFISRDEYEMICLHNRLIQGVEYNGELYGNDRHDVDPLLEECAGITAFVEDGVINFRRAGYDVRMIRIYPDGPGYVGRGAERERADRERALKGPVPDKVLTNRFEPGGFETACKILRYQIKDILGY